MSNTPRLKSVFLAAAALLAAAPLATCRADEHYPKGESQRVELLVLGAASLTNAFQEIGLAYTRETGQPVKFAFAASAVLARQIEAGIRADVLGSADVAWMDYLQARKLIDPATRRDVAGNRLVLIAPAGSSVRLRIGPGFALAEALNGGKLATGDPDFVPVGRYARSALAWLGAWTEVKDDLARAENVRAALAFVARGEAPLGIVYATDVLLDARVRTVDEFPAASHPRIVYPVAAITAARPGADRFVQFLVSSTAQAIFRRHGFSPPPQHGHSRDDGRMLPVPRKAPGPAT